ncbi:MAG: hypothetical protein H7338_06935, partial [Candidatus Sericytochromatia bacterium]|nr:hypothetical protein [Candidatus Sericytochromatia bacterium]
MSGASPPDTAIVEARRILLDALDALAGQHEALVLVGAQAIYLRVGNADLAVAPYTTDADLVVVPTQLADDPKLEQALRAAGLVPNPNQDGVGSWVRAGSDFLEVCVDFLVPEGLADPRGRRGARLGEHGDRTARKAKGLEAFAVEWDLVTVTALDPADTRRQEVRIAGPAALLIAKLHKLAERIDDPNRRQAKDALDIYRLLMAYETPELAKRMRRLLEDGSSATITREGLEILQRLFGDEQGPGSVLAGENVRGVGNPN